MRFVPESTPRTSRLAGRVSNASSKSLPKRSGARSLCAAAGAAAGSAIERLEGRQLFASVGAGQVGVFLGANGPTRINVSGSGSFDFVGATRGENGQARLNDMPMTIFDSDGNVVREVLGGYGGRDGIEPITHINGKRGRGLTTGPSSPYDTVPNTPTAIGGLATNSAGRTFGVNVVTDTNSSTVDLLDVSTKDGSVTVIENLAPKMLAQLRRISSEFMSNDVLDVIGADFDPNDPNTLYFACNINFPFTTGGGTQTSVTRKSIPAMFRYNLTTRAVTVDRGFFGVNAQDDAVRIDDFTFGDDGTVYIFGSVQDGTNPVQVGLFSSNKNNVIPGQFQAVTTGPRDAKVPVLMLAAMEFIPGEDYIIAVTDRSSAARLIRIDLSGDPDTAGRAIDLGPAVDPDDTADTKLGSNIADLSFSTRITDQVFQPGKRGVLLGTDTFDDVLVGLDSRERFQTPDLYAIYGNNVGSDTSIAVSVFTPDPDETRTPDFDDRLFRGVMNPYGSGAGVLRTFEETNTPLANGDLYLGIREQDSNKVLSLPVVTLSSTTDLAGAKFVKLPSAVHPGVYITGKMDDFLFAGTITGAVHIEGSVDTFYAGNVITSVGADNFFVDGDIRNLVVRGGLGDLPGAPDEYTARTDININGRVQAMKVGGNFEGGISVGGKRGDKAIGTAVNELETTVRTGITNSAGLAFEGRDGTTYLTGRASDGLQPGLETSAVGPSIVDGITDNDTYGTPQVLGTYYSKSRGANGQVTVNGSLNNGINFNDSQDYYGLPLLAGQTIQVGVLSADPLLLPVHLAVIDPDGRIVAQDLSNQNPDDFTNTTLSVTADKPGLWRLLVSVRITDTTNSSVAIDAYRPYTLTVDKAGDLALGGVVSRGNVTLNNLLTGVEVKAGDLGAILADGVLEGLAGAPVLVNGNVVGSAVIADTGNIRSLEGATISRFKDNLYQGFPNFITPQGSIGLIRADDFLYFNFAGLTAGGSPSPALTIGGDYQVIEAGGDFSANLSANGGIGVVRVDSWAQDIREFPGYIEINADDKGTAEVGLVDCQGNFGTFEFGGPAISEGQGGNFRYLHIGGRVYRDAGSGSGSGTTLTGTDRAVQITDDSGAIVTITPYVGVDVTGNTTEGGDGGTNNGIPDPFGGNGNPQQGNNGLPDPFGGSGSAIGGNPFDPFNGANAPVGQTPVIPDANIVGTLSIGAYPTRSSGSIIYSVESTTGVSVSVSKRGGGGSGDIGTLRSSSAVGGAPLVNPVSANTDLTVQPSREQTLSVGTGTTLDVILTGGRINVFELGSVGARPTLLLGTGGGFDEGTPLDFNRILNQTDGEIVNLRAADVSYLGAEYIGVARTSAGGVRVEGRLDATDTRDGNVGNAGPFVQQRNMVVLDNAISILARGPIGNILVRGTAQDIEANSDGKNTKGVFEGIVGPIYASSATYGGLLYRGRIRNIDVGEGLATSGSGDVNQSGLYSRGMLGLITNDNGGGDIRGDVLAQYYTEGFRLDGSGAILDSDIVQADPTRAVFSTITGVALNVRGGLGSEQFAFGLDIITNPLNTATLDGIGEIRIRGNGGILNSRIVAYNMGTFTVADTGFGIFTSNIISSSGATMDGVSVGGLGIRQSVYSGGSFIGDVVATGTGKLRSVNEFALNARPSETSTFDAATGIGPNLANDLNLILGTTKKVRKISGVTESGVIQDTLINAARSIDSVKAYEIRGDKAAGLVPTDDLYPMAINFADSIGTITTLRDIDGLRAVGGSVGTISAGRDLLHFELQARNRVKAVKAGRNITGTANLNLTANGSLDLLQAGGNLNGTAFVGNGIGSIIVGGDLGSSRDNGGIRSSTNINLLQVAGDVTDTGYVRADKTLKTLDLGGNVEADATVRGKSITKKTIDGVVYGSVVIG